MNEQGFVRAFVDANACGYTWRVIVDFHTHVFPPSVIAQRERLAATDDTFAELYGNPEARLATADDLLASMDAAGIDVSVALGFPWRDMAICREHNDYLLEAAALSNGRIVAFPSLPLGARLPSGAADLHVIEEEAQRCVQAGAKGFGELRPENSRFPIHAPSEPGDSTYEAAGLARLATGLGVVLLFHVSEPAGHFYPGKQGFAVEDFYYFVSHYPDAKVVGAHWAGGLPFYARMPEVRKAFESNLYVDSAASSLLYDDGVYEEGLRLIGGGHVLFGSDYPLLSQKRSRGRIEASGVDDASKRAVLGENAAQLLGLG